MIEIHFYVGNWCMVVERNEIRYLLNTMARNTDMLGVYDPES